MSYNLHITRAEEWYDSEENPITMEEWVELIKSDPQMELRDVAELTMPNESIISIKKPGMGLWRGQGYDLWFIYSDGNIMFDCPGEEALEKAKELAAKLNARVTGDEGEEY